MYIEMPNDCWNRITVTGEKEEIERFLKEEFKDTPDWALIIQRRGVGGIVFRLWSHWTPKFEWLEGLLDLYPDIWIKNEWSEEGGLEGVWIGTNREGEQNIERLEWMGMSLEEEFCRFKPLEEATQTS